MIFEYKSTCNTQNTLIEHTACDKIQGHTTTCIVADLSTLKVFADDITVYKLKVVASVSAADC